MGNGQVYARFVLALCVFDFDFVFRFCIFVCLSETATASSRGVARTGAGGPGPPWQKTGPLLGKSFFKKLINFNKEISVQNWHIFPPLSQKRYLLIIIMCPVMSAKVGPLNILCGPSWAKILATPLASSSHKV